MYWNDHRGSCANCVDDRGDARAPTPRMGGQRNSALHPVLSQRTLPTIYSVKDSHFCLWVFFKACYKPICGGILKWNHSVNALPINWWYYYLESKSESSDSKSHDKHGKRRSWRLDSITNHWQHRPYMNISKTTFSIARKVQTKYNSLTKWDVDQWHRMVIQGQYLAKSEPLGQEQQSYRTQNEAL